VADQPQSSLQDIDRDVVPSVITLDEADRLEPAEAQALLGTKAASLARLLALASRCPPGWW
jgi:hypothetical protein